MKSEKNLQNEPRLNRLKILAVGNSFSVDAMQHLYILAKDAGVEEIMLGNLYIGGCSLNTHFENVSENLGKYTFYVSRDEACGMVVEGEGRTVEYGIKYADWDYITVQQASNQSGIADSFSHLNELIDYINSRSESHAKIFWHQTWAYQSDSVHPGFANYGCSQKRMYQAIVDTVNELIAPNEKISGIIPSGTAIQNLRTSSLKDTLTRDGFHLSLGIGRYTAALTWLAKLTDADIRRISAIPEEYPEVGECLEDIKRAVLAAISEPMKITEL